MTDHWIQAPKKVAETIRVRERTVKDLLRDYMMTTMRRWNEEAGPVSRHLGAVMHELATNVEAATDILPPDISTSSSRRHRSKLAVPVEVAKKGLGDTGAIDIPDSVWDAMAPANFLWASEGTPPPSHFHRTRHWLHLFTLCWGNSLLRFPCRKNRRMHGRMSSTRMSTNAP